MIPAVCFGCGKDFFKKCQSEMRNAPRVFCCRQCMPKVKCACGLVFNARWASTTTCRKCNATAIRERNRETIRANQNAAYAANPERKKAAARRHYAENRVIHAAQSKQWIKDHPEARRAIVDRWKKNRPEVYKARYQRRRARQRNAIGSFTGAEWAALVKKQRGRCAECGKKAPLDADHIIPLADGGSSYIFNIQGLCGPCNGSKGAKIIPGSQSTLFDRPSQKVQV